MSAGGQTSPLINHITGKFCLATQADCTVSNGGPELVLSLPFPSHYTKLLSVHSISVVYCTFTRKQNCTLGEYIRRGTTFSVKEKKKRAVMEIFLKMPEEVRGRGHHVL